MDFDRLYQAHFRDVFVYLRSLSAAEDVAEEVAQDTFVRAMQAIDLFDGRQDIRAWLFAIARNPSYSPCRRPRRFVAADPPADPPDPHIFTEEMADGEYALRIHRFLHEMKEPYKEVFTLRVFGELSFEKIGLVFGKSPGWARVTYYRARKQIVAYLEGSEHETD